MGVMTREPAEGGEAGRAGMTRGAVRHSVAVRAACRRKRRVSSGEMVRNGKRAARRCRAKAHVNKGIVRVYGSAAVALRQCPVWKIMNRAAFNRWSNQRRDKQVRRYKLETIEVKKQLW